MNYESSSSENEDIEKLLPDNEIIFEESEPQGGAIVTISNIKSCAYGIAVGSILTLIACLVFFFVFSNCFSNKPLSTDNELGNVLTFSDLHYNPYYNSSLGPDCHCSNDYQPSELPDCPVTALNSNYGQVGCDPPLVLLRRTFEFAKAVNPNPDMILILGDFMRHYENIRQKSFNYTNAHMSNTIVNSMQTVRDMMREIWLDSPILFTLGNNDVYTDYYQPALPENQSHLEAIGRVWAEELEFITSKNQFDSEDSIMIENNATSTFSRGGYYRFQYSQRLVILSLNTNLMANYNMAVNCSNSDPSGMFTWLRFQLEQAHKNDHLVWIFGHIPVGLDHYELRTDVKLCFSQSYREILAPYLTRNMIKGQFFGHEHRNLFRGVQATPRQVLYLHSSLSPVYGNNPGFRQWKFIRHSGVLADYSAYYFNISALDPAFKLMFVSEEKEYNISDPFDPQWMKTFVDRLSKDRKKGGLFDLFWRNSAYLGNPIVCPNLEDECVQQEICALRYLTKENFENCMETHEM